ncbi:MAG: hypothetical protein IT514_01570 [Burkholderiales bacterium]|nr:hypothetical protein [Burkholderiales bacterium]
MAQIFHHDGVRWEIERLTGSYGALSFAPLRFDPLGEGREADAAACALGRFGSSQAWVLFPGCGERLLHNGQPVTAGLRVLAHGDALALEGRQSVFFSTEEAARVESFAGPGKATCPRCRGEILPGQPAVKCPRCSVSHHQSEDRNCWTYAVTCALCAQPSDLSAGLRWSPESL